MCGVVSVPVPGRIFLSCYLRGPNRRLPFPLGPHSVTDTSATFPSILRFTFIHSFICPSIHPYRTHTYSYQSNTLYLGNYTAFAMTTISPRWLHASVREHNTQYTHGRGMFFFFL